MNFKVGDTAVCVDSIALPGYKNTRLVAGSEYLVTDVVEPCGGGCFSCVRVEGQEYRYGKCTFCNHEVKFAHFAWRFIKLDKLLTEQEQSVEA